MLPWQSVLSLVSARVSMDCSKMSASTRWRWRSTGSNMEAFKESGVVAVDSCKNGCFNSVPARLWKMSVSRHSKFCPCLETNGSGKKQTNKQKRYYFQVRRKNLFQHAKILHRQKSTNCSIDHVLKLLNALDSWSCLYHTKFQRSHFKHARIEIFAEAGIYLVNFLEHMLKLQKALFSWLFPYMQR